MHSGDLRSDLTALGAVAQRPSLERALDAVRELLDMDIAYATRFEDGDQVFLRLRGDGAGFGVQEGARMALENTYCQQILAERLPAAIGDVRGHPVAGAMPITAAAGVGAYASIPLVLSDGRLFGTLCCASRATRPDLDERDVRFLRVMGRMVCGVIEAEERELAVRRLQVEAASVDALVCAIEARDHYTAEHSRAVVAHAIGVARMLGLDEHAVGEVEQVALLHDIGKIAVPDAVLRKPGPLDDGEWEIMRGHSTASARMVAGIPGLSHLAATVRAEHERWDGTGYPDGMAGEGIPLPARIVLACDAYHAMTTDRPYRPARSDDEARAELRACAGSQLDPSVVTTLLRVLEAEAAAG